MSVVDLSVDLEMSPDVNNNPSAERFKEVAASNPEIHTALVVEHGRIVAEYVRDGFDPNEPSHIWSSTKSWSSLLVGKMVESGLLSLNERHGDIWPDDENVWSSNVTADDVEVRKNVTIWSLSTISSGLIFPQTRLGNPFDGGDGGGATLVGSLSFPDSGEKGTCSYLAISNIMSYVIQERSGMSTREYASQTVFPALGMSESDFGWWRNKDVMEYAYHGMLLTARQMAKFGQLYLQEGLAGPNERLISSDWVSNSSYPHVEATVQLGVSPPMNFTAQYAGYLFWVTNGGGLLGSPDFAIFVVLLVSVAKISASTRNWIGFPSSRGTTRMEMAA